MEHHKDWCDDDRAPYVSQSTACKYKKTASKHEYESINNVLKDVVKTIESKKRNLLWNEVEYKHWDYEWPLLVYDTKYYQEGNTLAIDATEDEPEHSTAQQENEKQEDKEEECSFDKWFQNPYAYI